MLSERVRVIAIFVALIVTAIGGGYYFFKVYQPGQIRDEARAEIAQWEQRFETARTCLLGARPASSVTAEALAIREMAPDPWDGRSCTPLIGKLTRGDAPRTQLDAVEAAWTELDAAAIKAARAFGTHVEGSTMNDPLPEALDALDAARKKLRRAADLPEKTEHEGNALAPAQLVPVMDGNAPVTELRHADTDSPPSAHGIVLFGTAGNREVQINLIASATPQVGSVVAGTIRALPDPSWGALAGDAEVSIGGVSRDGAMPSPIQLPLVGAQDVTVAAAAGTLASGVVAYGSSNEIVIAHVREGAVTAEPPIRSVLVAWATADADGRIALAWTTNDREHHARILNASGDEPTVELTELVSPGAKRRASFEELSARPMIAGPPCLARDRGWVVFPNRLVSFGGGRKPTIQPIEGVLIGCTPDGALLWDALADSPTYTICADDCRQTNLQRFPNLVSAPTMLGGRLVLVAAHDHAIGVWREDTEPRFYGLPESVRLVPLKDRPALALTDGKVIDLLARTTKGHVVVRIPAN
jgi:hypothetical protein